MIHTDFAVMNGPSIRGARYFVTFINEAYGNVRAFHMKSKSEAAQLLKCEVSWVERHSECIVKKTGLAGGKEYAEGSEDLEARGNEA